MMTRGRVRRSVLMPGRASLCALGAAALLFARAVGAAPITVSVTTKAGGPAEDAVILLDALDATAASPARESTVIDQINKRFVPRVTVVRTGTSVTFPNSDHIRHQVYSFSPAKPFTLKLYAGTPPTAVLFDRPGLVVLGCNIHDQMVAFVGVVDTPYFAKTTATGIVTVEVPSGRYRMRVWHPAATTLPLPHDITVRTDGVKIPLTLDLNEGSAHVAGWPD